MHTYTFTANNKLDCCKSTTDCLSHFHKLVWDVVAVLSQHCDVMASVLSTLHKTVSNMSLILIIISCGKFAGNCRYFVRLMIMPYRLKWDKFERPSSWRRWQGMMIIVSGRGSTQQNNVVIDVSRRHHRLDIFAGGRSLMRSFCLVIGHHDRQLGKLWARFRGQEERTVAGDAKLSAVTWRAAQSRALPSVRDTRVLDNWHRWGCTGGAGVWLVMSGRWRDNRHWGPELVTTSPTVLLAQQPQHHDHEDDNDEQTDCYTCISIN